MNPEQTTKKPLRAAFPAVSVFIDACRAAFGAEEINSSIRAGLNGQDTFYAAEGGNSIGTLPTPPGLHISGDDLIRPKVIKP